MHPDADLVTVQTPGSHHVASGTALESAVCTRLPAPWVLIAQLGQRAMTPSSLTSFASLPQPPLPSWHFLASPPQKPFAFEALFQGLLLGECGPKQGGSFILLLLQGSREEKPLFP